MVAENVETHKQFTKALPNNSGQTTDQFNLELKSIWEEDGYGKYAAIVTLKRLIKNEDLPDALKDQLNAVQATTEEIDELIDHAESYGCVIESDESSLSILLEAREQARTREEDAFVNGDNKYEITFHSKHTRQQRLG